MKRNFIDIFVPNFCFQFDVEIVDLHYTPSMGKKLDAARARIIEYSSEHVRFLINTSKLLNRFRIGKSEVIIKHKSQNAFQVTITFLTQKMAFLIISAGVSSALVISAIVTRESVFSKLVVIPLVYLSGHMYFWGSIAANTQRIKKFIIGLGD